MLFCLQQWLFFFNGKICRVLSMGVLSRFSPLMNLTCGSFCWCSFACLKSLTSLYVENVWTKHGIKIHWPVAGVDSQSNWDWKWTIISTVNESKSDHLVGKCSHLTGLFLSVLLSVCALKLHSDENCPVCFFVYVRSTLKKA